MYLYITKYSHVPFLKNPMFFLIRFKAKQKLKMFMGETNFHEIYTQFWFLGRKRKI